MKTVNKNKDLYCDNLNTFNEIKGMKYLKIKNKIEVPKINNTKIDIVDKFEYFCEKKGSKSLFKIKIKSKIINNTKQE